MSELLDELLADAAERMSKSVEATNHEFGSVRTGRASPALLDRVHVEYYGVSTPRSRTAATWAATARTRSGSVPYSRSPMSASPDSFSRTRLKTGAGDSLGTGGETTRRPRSA